jgi:GNAT superfamily N-acetyltransferase
MIVKTQFTRIKEIEIAKFNEKNEQISVVYLILHTRPNGEIVGLIEDVETREDSRKKGYASELMQEAIKTAKEAGAYKICLACADYNLSFYSKLGFKIHQNAMRYFVNG